ncbi:hypothetical protein M885DRAFT_73633 [Pelagophyceae sp. CCMP2097]|nr:hypothetical protein M885DRAFT_73633 [Pelagophyceae sp. CCMP2097]
MDPFPETSGPVHLARGFGSPRAFAGRNAVPCLRGRFLWGAPALRRRCEGHPEVAHFEKGVFRPGRWTRDLFAGHAFPTAPNSTRPCMQSLYATCDPNCPGRASRRGRRPDACRGNAVLEDRKRPRAKPHPVARPRRLSKKAVGRKPLEESRWKKAVGRKPWTRPVLNGRRRRTRRRRPRSQRPF